MLFPYFIFLFHILFFHCFNLMVLIDATVHSRSTTYDHVHCTAVQCTYTHTHTHHLDRVPLSVQQQNNLFSYTIMRTRYTLHMHHMNLSATFIPCVHKLDFNYQNWCVRNSIMLAFVIWYYLWVPINTSTVGCVESFIALVNVIVNEVRVYCILIGMSYIYWKRQSLDFFFFSFFLVACRLQQQTIHFVLIFIHFWFR